MAPGGKRYAREYIGAEGVLSDRNTKGTEKGFVSAVKKRKKAPPHPRITSEGSRGGGLSDKKGPWGKKSPGIKENSLTMFLGRFDLGRRGHDVRRANGVG